MNYFKGLLSEDLQWFWIQDHLELRHHLIKLLGQPLLLSAEQLFNKRSGRQNRYLHGVIVPCVITWARETKGETWTKEKAKAFIYIEVLGYEIQIEETESGKTMMWFQQKQFSNMNTKEFNENKEIVQFYFANRGKFIPDPKGDNTLNDFL